MIEKLSAFESSDDYSHWSCPFCGNEEFTPVSSLGYVFVCPDCGERNVQVEEPAEVKESEGDKFLCYHSSSTICMYCESEFKQGLFTNNLNNPETFHFALYRNIK